MRADEMEEISRAVRAAAGAVPNQAWSLDEIQARAHRHRWWWYTRLTAIITVLLTALVGGTTVLVTAGSDDSAGESPQLRVLATDADHLYATWTDCATSPCRQTLLGSDDGGATW